ncbi:hypothetical protein BUE80_DR001433 [Diplocarpon rosae]|nr:hypothetical protein BUE80_DR001433 [Diplocarpon rosae]
MTSSQNVSPRHPQHRNASDSPIDRRNTSSTFSSSSRYAVASSETGESSRAASRQTSLRATSMDSLSNGEDGTPDIDEPGQDSMGAHRSRRRDRTKGGFLLSNSVFGRPAESSGRGTATDSFPRQRQSTQEQKGKGALRSSEKNSGRSRSNLRTSAGGRSPTANITNVGTANDNIAISGRRALGIETRDYEPAAKATATALDVDSAKIVNLALNLSESRRNAQRRIVSTPLPPTLGPGESFTGGSLRHHLQQQRRVSRNVSPKPDRVERTMAASPRLVSGQRINSTFHASFESHPEAQYQYHFSASTLARAEKAKKAIELMAQYRRLLQYVPPLKPQAAEKAVTPSSAGTAPGSPVLSSPLDPSRTIPNKSLSRALGRPYNPLQYIRNRKVRSRNSRAIDGEALGFADLEKVSSWVDAVSQHASSENAHAIDFLTVPQLSKAAEDAVSPFGSPHSSLGKSHGPPVKAKRPRNDWIIDPVDMIADMFWIEQDDNKKLIEDRHGRKIFPQTYEPKRPVSRIIQELDPKKIASPKERAEDLGIDLRLDTKLPQFKSVKLEPERFPDLSTSKARRKFREVRAAAGLHHGYSGSIREIRQVRSSRSRSDDWDSSDSDYAPKKRGHSGSADDVVGQGKDILEKQMMEIIAREAQETLEIPRDNKGRRSSIATPKPPPKDIGGTPTNGSGGHSRSTSSLKGRRGSTLAGSSGRPSLEVPVRHSRASFEEHNTTAPNSPAAGPSDGDRVISGLDLSSRRSRPTSPSRRPLSRMRSKIRPFIERNHDSGNHFDDDTTLANSIEYDLDTPDSRRRSISPAKKIVSRTADEGQKSSKNPGSVRKGKGEESGIRGLFKNARNPVSRVSDLIRRRDSSAGIGSGFSTDESDLEEIRSPKHIHSRDSSVGASLDDFDEASPESEKLSYMNGMPSLPVFTSPFESRGRPTRMQSEEPFLDPDSKSRKILRREKHKMDGPDQPLDPTPRIDVQNASPTPFSEKTLLDEYRRDSSVSDFDSRRNSLSGGVHTADARRNSILGIPGKRRNALPITGLANLETSRSHRQSLERQWSISDRSPSEHRGPMNRREIARVRALLLSSGIKAKEISRRAAELKNLSSESSSPYFKIAVMAREDIEPVQKSQLHRLAARIISDDVQLSSQKWQDSADNFVKTTAPLLLSRISELQHKLADNLTPATRTAADDADEVSKDLVTSQMLKVKRIGDKVDKMTRTRRRKFRWARRGGWVVVEWLLVGVMWYVWFMVVIARVFMGIGRGVVGSIRWLFWL